jgi:sugar phosphate isomerase/epimerase
MKQLANYAKERGVMIYFETGQETPTTLIRALKDIGTGNVFINCDVANLLLYGKANPTDAIRLFGPLVKDIHAKDGTYPSREDPYNLGQEKPIPEGDVDFPAIIKILKEEGYKGAITIEYELNEKSQNYLAKTRKYLQDLIDKE